MAPTQSNRPLLQRAFIVRVIATLAAAAVVGLVALWLARTPQISTSSLVGGPFALEDGEGKTITNETLRGR